MAQGGRTPIAGCLVLREGSKLRTHSGLQTHSKLLPALDLHGPLYMALANQIFQGTKRRVLLSMKTDVLGGTVLGHTEG